MSIETDGNALVPRQILDAAAATLESHDEAETAGLLRGSQASAAEMLSEALHEVVGMSGSPDALSGYRAGARVGAMEMAVEVRGVLRNFTDKQGLVRAWRIREALDREWSRRVAM